MKFESKLSNPPSLTSIHRSPSQEKIRLSECLLIDEIEMHSKEKVELNIPYWKQSKEVIILLLQGLHIITQVKINFKMTSLLGSIFGGASEDKEASTESLFAKFRCEYEQQQNTK